jgi:long-chain acyl-CoA synthetase
MRCNKQRLSSHTSKALARAHKKHRQRAGKRQQNKNKRMKLLQNSDKIALIYKNEQISYDRFIGITAIYARLISAAPGDRVAIFSENRPEWTYAFYAAWRKQAIPVPIDAMASVDEIAYILKDSTPNAVFVSPQLQATMEKAIAQAECQTTLHVFGHVAIPESFSEEDRQFPEVGADETAVIIYTSGTTGSPKGVMLSYENLRANLVAVSDQVPIYRTTDRVMILLPLHHVLPLQGTMIMPLSINATCVMAPSMVAADILQTFADNQVTLFIGVPRLYILLRDGLKSRIRQSKIASALFALCAAVNSLAFSRLVFRSVQKRFGGAVRHMPCGGAALDIQVVKDFRTLGFEILLGYGMTETAPMISFTRPGGHRDGSAGQLVPCNEVRIVDGEITVRGKNVMKGYYQRPEETAAIMKDGWLYTGDLGYVDVDNYIYITGRKKEIIVLPNGKNINPEEVEQKVLGSSDWIAEIAVLAAGDALQALILPNFTALQSQGVLNIEESIRQQVIARYNEQASSYKRIFKCSFVSEPLPRTRLGKLKRHELEAIAKIGGTRKKEQVAEPKSEEYRVIKQYLVGQLGEDIHPDDHFEMDLSLDSLGKVSFQVFLSGTFNTEITEQMLLEYPTPAKLAAKIHDRGHDAISSDSGFKWGKLLREKVAVKLPRSGFSHQWLNLFSKSVLHSFFTLRAEGLQNIPEGPCIFAPNHQSYLDALFISAFLKKGVLKQTLFYAKAEHLRHRWQRFMAHRHNVIVMDINNDLKLSLQKLASALAQGKKVIIFPEGTRSVDGQLGDFKQTFAILGRELNVPIVPIALAGAYQALPRNRFFPKLFKPIKVSFLPAIIPEEGDDYGSLVDKAVSQIRDKLSELLPPEQPTV